MKIKGRKSEPSEPIIYGEAEYEETEIDDGTFDEKFQELVRN